MATNWRDCTYLATGELKCKINIIEHYVDDKDCCQNKKLNGLFSPSCTMCVKVEQKGVKSYVDAANVFDTK